MLWESGEFCILPATLHYEQMLIRSTDKFHRVSWQNSHQHPGANTTRKTDFHFMSQPQIMSLISYSSGYNLKSGHSRFKNILWDMSYRQDGHRKCRFASCEDQVIILRINSKHTHRLDTTNTTEEDTSWLKAQLFTFSVAFNSSRQQWLVLKASWIGCHDNKDTKIYVCIFFCTLINNIHCKWRWVHIILKLHIVKISRI